MLLLMCSSILSRSLSQTLLQVRWYQLAAFYPFMRGHAHLEAKRREPWLFGEENTDRIRDAIRQRSVGGGCSLVGGGRGGLGNACASDAPLPHAELALNLQAAGRQPALLSFIGEWSL